MEEARQRKTSNLQYLSCVALFAYMCFRYLATHFFWEPHSVYEWPSISNLLLSLKLENGSLFLSDEYIEASLQSPNIIFSFLANLITLTGLNIYNAYYILDLILEIFSPIVILLLFYRIQAKWANTLGVVNKIDTLDFAVIFGIVLLLSNAYFINAVIYKTLPIIDLPADSFVGFFEPFGWSDPLSQLFVAPSTFAFFLGVVYLLNCRNHTVNSSSILPACILCAATVIHPVVGMCHFVLGCIIDGPLVGLIRVVKYRSLDFLVGLVIPVVAITSFFASGSHPDPQVFIDTYVDLRHPHHYKMSDVIDIWSSLWVLILFLLLFATIRLKSSALIGFASLSIGCILGAVLVQFMGVEIFSIEQIAILGPSRFTQYLFLLAGINLSLLLIRWRHWQLSGTSKINPPEPNQKHECKKRRPLLEVSGAITFSLIAFALFSVTEGQKFSSQERYMSGLNWIKSNTEKDDVFFVQQSQNLESGNVLSFLIRAVAERNIYIDHAFPFDLSSVEKWGDKFKIYNDLEFSKPDAARICALKNNVDYFLLGPKTAIYEFEANYRDSTMEIISAKKLYREYQC